ncbi:hypothetical protein H257_16402 [Aphanomyces astaci]|uniref:Uncharacterized protein n=1 Tax=Aphanomyces astaci TaxID=112090 RepID=W4FKM6_APHAT|nr:hypothetical protein H257_16402 [Aphanomyces astaci]ETV67426.1 hypothetical protein H257_16402 [Aphanomyces astaci]|eukprot:XP_009843117.1 hypothetical protein H257_16402 [Aphanomyces astaci]
MHSASTRDLEASTGIPKSNLARWVQQAHQLLNVNGPLKRYNLDGADRPVEIPDSAALESFMHKLWDDERALTCTHLVNFLKRNNRTWLATYLAEKNCGYQSLLKLLQRFCHRHGFTTEASEVEEVSSGAGNNEGYVCSRLPEGIQRLRFRLDHQCR